MPRRDYDSDLDERPRRRRRPSKKPKGVSPILIIAFVGLGLLLLTAGGVAVFLLNRAKAPAAENDLDRLAGRWESTFRDGAGRVTMHKVKEINGTTETATWYRPDGTVYRVNRVDFELLQRGKNKVFRYFNGSVIDDRGVMQPFPAGEYVYTLEGDTWTEYDPSGQAIIVWTRTR